MVYSITSNRVLRPSPSAYTRRYISESTCRYYTRNVCYREREVGRRQDDKREIEREHTHMYTHMHTHMHTHMYTHMHTHVHTHVHTHAYTHTCIYTHAHTCTHIHTHAYTHTRTHIHMRTHIHAHTYTCARTYMHTHTPPPTHTHTTCTHHSQFKLLPPLWLQCGLLHGCLEHLGDQLLPLPLLHGASTHGHPLIVPARQQAQLALKVWLDWCGGKQSHKAICSTNGKILLLLLLKYTNTDKWS